MRLRSLMRVAVLTLPTVYASPASATLVTSTSTFNIGFDQAVAGHADLTGTLSLTVTGLTSTEVELAVTVSNTTPLSEPSARLIGFGWDSAPAPTVGTESSSMFSLYTDANFPSFSLIDTCLSSGGSCPGGGAGGLSPQQSDSFALRLFVPSASQLDFSDFAAKYQADFGSFAIAGRPTVVAAEPRMVGLFGLALVGLAIIRWFRS